jgi:hypothetical protein
MESVATQFLNLLKLAGIGLNETRTTLQDGSVDISYRLPFPLRRVQATRRLTGDIDIEISQGECFVATLIEAFHVDMSAANTMVISNSTNTLAENAQALETVIEVPTLYVFRPGIATFTFVVTSTPMNTAILRVTGFRLPGHTLDVLRRLGTESLVM